MYQLINIGCSLRCYRLCDRHDRRSPRRGLGMDHGRDVGFMRDLFHRSQGLHDVGINPERHLLGWERWRFHAAAFC